MPPLNLLFLTFIFFFVAPACQNSAVKINMRGPVKNGGRAIAVTIDPTNNNNVWVASATGGLYHSTNGGARWTRVEELPEFAFYDVQFAPSDANTIIATCIEDTKTSNGGGIWLSTDAGASWSQPPGSRLYKPRKGKKEPLITKRYSAYGISFMPFTQKVFAGSDYGLAVSDDLGRHWQYVQPAGNTPDQPHPIYSVLTMGNGQVIVAGDDGILSSNNGKNGWTVVPGGFINDFSCKNSLATLSGNEGVLFFAGDGRYALKYKLPTEDNWRDIDTSAFETINANGRRTYIKVVRVGTTRDEYYVYYSFLGALGLLHIKWTGSDISVIDDWKMVNMQHVDQSDLAFANFPAGHGIMTLPVYATNDGGVEKTINAGDTWTQVGNINTDFNALQVYDLFSVRRANDADKQLDIYFGTQDNGLYGSSNSGLTWTYYKPDEGANVQGAAARQFNDATYAVTWLNISGGYYEKYFPAGNSNKLMVYPFQPYRNWQTNALYNLRVNTYVAIGADRSNNQQVAFTNDNAFSWRSIYQPEHKLYLYSFISGDLGTMGTNNSPAVSIIGAHHVPVRMTLGSIPGRTGINMIIRIDGLFNRIVGDEQETPVPLPLNCAIATYGSQWRPDIASFGVDPGDPGFIIVPDIHNNTIHITKDSGRTWDRRDDLVNLITDNGKYLFTLENDSRERFEVASSQVSCIRFDPSNHNNIAMGTAEAGLILSTDHGKTWKKISHSEKIGNITDISFNGGKMFVSSWGSGIWCISFD